jgi:hypothetical protein
VLAAPCRALRQQTPSPAGCSCATACVTSSASVSLGQTAALLVVQSRTNLASALRQGEVAIRICRAAGELGIRTVAVYSEDDATSLHTKKADVAVPLTGAGVGASAYLNQEALLAVAQEQGCSAVHCGYGFLSENATFVARVEGAGLTFIGPPSSAIELFGDKTKARELAQSVGVPLLPGTWPAQYPLPRSVLQCVAVAVAAPASVSVRVPVTHAHARTHCLSVSLSLCLSLSLSVCVSLSLSVSLLHAHSPAQVPRRPCRLRRRRSSSRAWLGSR